MLNRISKSNSLSRFILSFRPMSTKFESSDLSNTFASRVESADVRSRKNEMRELRKQFKKEVEDLASEQKEREREERQRIAENRRLRLELREKRKLETEKLNLERAEKARKMREEKRKVTAAEYEFHFHLTQQHVSFTRLSLSGTRRIENFESLASRRKSNS